MPIASMNSLVRNECRKAGVKTSAVIAAECKKLLKEASEAAMSAIQSNISAK